MSDTKPATGSSLTAALAARKLERQAAKAEHTASTELARKRRQRSGVRLARDARVYAELLRLQRASAQEPKIARRATERVAALLTESLKEIDLYKRQQRIYADAVGGFEHADVELRAAARSFASLAAEITDERLQRRAHRSALRATRAVTRNAAYRDRFAGYRDEAAARVRIIEDWQEWAQREDIREDLFPGVVQVS